MNFMRIAVLNHHDKYYRLGDELAWYSFCIKILKHYLQNLLYFSNTNFIDKK